MEKTDAFLHISVSLECPHCATDIDLMDISELTDEGHLQKTVFNDTFWGIKDLDAEIECHECKNTINVGEVIW